MNFGGSEICGGGKRGQKAKRRGKRFNTEVTETLRKSEFGADGSCVVLGDYVEVLRLSLSDKLRVTRLECTRLYLGRSSSYF
jgi:hypothetical protein